MFLESDIYLTIYEINIKIHRPISVEVMLRLTRFNVACVLHSRVWILSGHVCVWTCLSM